MPYFERVSPHTTGLTVLRRVAPMRLPTCFLTLLRLVVSVGIVQPTDQTCLCGMRLWRWLFIIGLWKLVKNVCQVRLHGDWMKDAAFWARKRLDLLARLEPNGVSHTCTARAAKMWGARSAYCDASHACTRFICYCVNTALAYTFAGHLSLKQNGVFTSATTSGYTDSHTAHSLHIGSRTGYCSSR